MGPKCIGERVYAALIALLSLFGAGVAARHIWIQNLPKDQIPACVQGLDYMHGNHADGRRAERTDAWLR